VSAAERLIGNSIAKVRLALDEDIPAITEIYAHHVRHGAATFEIVPPDAAEMKRRRCDVAQNGFPWLVAEIDGQLAGYAYAGPYRARPAYRFTVEDSVYLHPAYVGRGLGTILLPRLIVLCEEAGARQMVAVIGDSKNTASIRLHENFGFELTGVLRSVGFKFGRWVDTVLMQRRLGAGDTTPPI
jgi:L-amino acid N-acyltransferase YncA